MSKKDERELEKILKNLKRFANRRDGHVLAAITYPQTEEEAKGVYVAGDWVHFLTVGDTAIPLDMIHSKFYNTLKQFEERDKAVIREMKMMRKKEQEKTHKLSPEDRRKIRKLCPQDVKDKVDSMMGKKVKAQK